MWAELRANRPQVRARRIISVLRHSQLLRTQLLCVCVPFDVPLKRKMTHNVLVVGFGDRPFNFPVSTDVETGTLRDWIDQKLVCGVRTIHERILVFETLSNNNRAVGLTTT